MTPLDLTFYITIHPIRVCPVHSTPDSNLLNLKIILVHMPAFGKLGWIRQWLSLRPLGPTLPSLLSLLLSRDLITPNIGRSKI